jgi:hypothetical protein
MKLGFSIAPNCTGIGDAIQFTSLPENYFRSTGDTLVDVSKHWAFDFNPYVVRDVIPEKVIELWNWPKLYDWPLPKRCLTGSPKVYTSNAEIWANLFNVPVTLNHPRLYRDEGFPFYDRKDILFLARGKSHGLLPQEVITHVMDKYYCGWGTENFYQIGENLPPLHYPDGRIEHRPQPIIPHAGRNTFFHIRTRTIWDLAQLISRCRMLIAVDSGPVWIATCYPDVQIKRIRNLPVHGQRSWNEWIPLEIENPHSHWDDCNLFTTYHTMGTEDIGFMKSWVKI